MVISVKVISVGMLLIVVVVIVKPHGLGVVQYRKRYNGENTVSIDISVPCPLSLVLSAVS